MIDLEEIEWRVKYEKKKNNKTYCIYRNIVLVVEHQFDIEHQYDWYCCISIIIDDSERKKTKFLTFSSLPSVGKFITEIVIARLFKINPKQFFVFKSYYEWLSPECIKFHKPAMIVNLNDILNTKD